MPEVDIVRRIRAQAARSTGILQGIGDDCAILRPDPRSDLVFTTDFLIEDRHFTQATHKPADVGHKALARSLSDIAAMGAEPVFCLVSLALPTPLTGRWLNSFYRGLLHLADRYNVALAGGDLSQSPQIIADVMCCGRVPRSKALLRSGAKPRDIIYVTGRLGKPWRKHLRPEPRIEAGVALRGIAHAAMDLSDGLSLDLQRLCSESNVGANLESSRIPVQRGSTLAQALHGGEDYELLFTASPRAKLPSSLNATAIGTITPARSHAVHMDGIPLAAEGFDHFAHAVP